MSVLAGPAHDGVFMRSGMTVAPRLAAAVKTASGTVKSHWPRCGSISFQLSCSRSHLTPDASALSCCTPALVPQPAEFATSPTRRPSLPDCGLDAAVTRGLTTTVMVAD